MRKKKADARTKKKAKKLVKQVRKKKRAEEPIPMGELFTKEDDDFWKFKRGFKF